MDNHIGFFNQIDYGFNLFFLALGGFQFYGVKF